MMPGEAPQEFLDAIAQLRSLRPRPEVQIEEVPTPQRIAPHALAMAGDVLDQDEELATGRFVLLYDPAGQEAWEGRFRAVTYARAVLESEMGSDPLLSQVGWSWVADALDSSGAARTALGGTVTRVVSESFEALADRPPVVEIEIRASWTPQDDASRHLLAWTHLLCAIAGLPPLPEGVSALSRRRLSWPNAPRD